MKNTRKIQLCLSRNSVVRSRIKKRKRVDERPWATNEASDGSRPLRSAASSGRLFLPAAVRTCQIEFRFFTFRIEFNLYLIGQKMNHQAGILRIITENQIQQRSKKGLSRSILVENRISIWGVCPPRHGMFYVTEVDHANWCHVVC